MNLGFFPGSSGSSGKPNNLLWIIIIAVAFVALRKRPGLSLNGLLFRNNAAGFNGANTQYDHQEPSNSSHRRSRRRSSGRRTVDYDQY